MNDSERAVCEYLKSLDVGEVRYEPDGNVPPDFSLGVRIGVEARRLNENEDVHGGYRGLEVTAKPLHSAVMKSLDGSGPPVDSRSWFVHYTARRPLPPWKHVESSLRNAVREFRQRMILRDAPTEIRLGRWMRMRFQPASRQHSTLLLLGSWSDHDSGGFVVAELARNLRICVQEKVRKVGPFRHRYAEWWLALEDRIAYGDLDDDDVKQLRKAVGPISGFDRVVLVTPLQPTKAIEVYSAAGPQPNTAMEPTARTCR